MGIWASANWAVVNKWSGKTTDCASDLLVNSSDGLSLPPFTFTHVVVYLGGYLSFTLRVSCHLDV